MSGVRQVYLQGPAAVSSVAVDILVHAARQRHGNTGVLHALARRERDHHDALRVI